MSSHSDVCFQKKILKICFCTFILISENHITNNLTSIDLHKQMCASDRYENKISPQIKCTSACLPVCQGDFLAKLNRIYWKIVPDLRFLLPKQGEMNTFRFPPHFRRRYPFYREAILDILSPRRNHENRENVLCARNSKWCFKPCQGLLCHEHVYIQDFICWCQRLMIN